MGPVLTPTPSEESQGVKEERLSDAGYAQISSGSEDMEGGNKKKVKGNVRKEKARSSHELQYGEDEEGHGDIKSESAPASNMSWLATSLSQDPSFPSFE